MVFMGNLVSLNSPWIHVGTFEWSVGIHNHKEWQSDYIHLEILDFFPILRKSTGFMLVNGYIWKYMRFLTT